MHQRLRASLAAFLSCSLLILPASASPSNPFGTVISAQRAHVGSTPASLGATIYGGDRLTTEATGALQVRTGSARFYLAASSAADFSAATPSAPPLATLLAGTAIFSSSSSSAFELVAKDARVRMQGDGPFAGQVSITGPRELLVTSRRGTLVITVAEETALLTEGKAVRVLLDPPPDPADPQGPRGAGTKGMKNKPRRAARSYFIYVVVGLTAVVTYIAVDEALESPHKP